MAIRFTCPQCDQRLSVASEKAEQDVTCPRCQQVVRVPPRCTAATPPPPPPAPGTDVPPESRAEPANELVYAEDQEESAAVRGREGQLVSIPRRVIYLQGILLGLVALVFFVFGMIVGSRSDSGATHAPGQPCTVSGMVLYDSPAERSMPDADSTVIIVPLASRPDQKAAAAGLRPSDPTPGEEHPGVALIRSLGGAFARVDRSGRFRVRVMIPGRYYILVVSRHARRTGDEQPQAKDLAQIGRYVVPATSLLENQRYTWQELRIRADCEFAHTF